MTYIKINKKNDVGNFLKLLLFHTRLFWDKNNNLITIYLLISTLNLSNQNI